MIIVFLTILNPHDIWSWPSKLSSIDLLILLSLLYEKTIKVSSTSLLYFILSN